MLSQSDEPTGWGGGAERARRRLGREATQRSSASAAYVVTVDVTVAPPTLAEAFTVTWVLPFGRLTEVLPERAVPDVIVTVDGLGPDDAPEAVRVTRIGPPGLVKVLPNWSISSTWTVNERPLPGRTGGALHVVAVDTPPHTVKPVLPSVNRIPVATDALGTAAPAGVLVINGATHTAPAPTAAPLRRVRREVSLLSRCSGAVSSAIALLGPQPGRCCRRTAAKWGKYRTLDRPRRAFLGAARTWWPRPGLRWWTEGVSAMRLAR